MTAMTPEQKEQMIQALNELWDSKMSKEFDTKLDKALEPLTKGQANYIERFISENPEKLAAVKTKRPQDLGLGFARTVRAFGMACLEDGKQKLVSEHGEAIERAAFYAKKNWGDNDPVYKSLQASVQSQAGAMIRPDWNAEWIELLRNVTVVRKLASIYPMPVGSTTFRRQTAPATAAYTGESVYVSPSQQTMDLLSFVYKKLMAVTPVSNDLLRFAGSEADAFVRNDLLRVAAIREDLAFLRGDGTVYTPTGILSLVNSSNLFNQTGTALANVQADFAKAIRLLEEANIPVEEADEFNILGGCSWIFAPRTKWGVYNQVSTTGNYVFAPEMREKGTILGHKFATSNQIPKNLGGGGNQSESYFVHGPSLMIADSLRTVIDVFPGGAYYDGSAVVSGISKDETVVRLTSEHDFGMRHNVGAAVIQQVTLQ